MKIHPAAELFPMMGAEDLEALAESIKKYGQQMPCVKDGDTLIDGRNRVAACALLGVEPRFVEYRDVVSRRGEQRENQEAIPLPSEYIFALNFDRRQLTPDQSSMVSVKWLPIYSAEAKERQRAGLTPGNSAEKRNVSSVSNVTDDKKERRTDQELAYRARVSRRKVRQAMEVAAASPELAEKVERGEMKLVDAHKEVTASKPKAKREKKQPTLEDLPKRWQKFLDAFSVTDHGAVKAWIRKEIKL